MCARSRTERARGMSLSEAMVSLLILTMVMIVALTLLFTMKSFAERQQMKTAPRQTSRQAMEYVGSFLTGATDLNDLADPPNPNAIVTWYTQGNSSSPRQASFNNLKNDATESKLGEVGTDIITISVPANQMLAPFTKWPGQQHSSTAWINFKDGCGPDPGNDTEMTRRFLELTGADITDPARFNEAKSGILTVIDANGQWAYYEITSYQQFDCDSVDSSTGLPNPVHIVANPGQSQRINPPGGQPTLVPPVSLAGGMRFMSFRVRRPDPNDPDSIPNLEQKQGLFDPTTDNPGTAFVPIIPDVEDLQVAYLYSQPLSSGSITNRTVWNTWTGSAGAVIPADPPDVAGTDNFNNVPPQGTSSAWDITRVAGVRLSITSRSAPLRFEARNISVRRGSTTRTNARPRSEDRAGAAPGDRQKEGATTGRFIGDFDHHRMTSTLLIRNRMLGN